MTSIVSTLLSILNQTIYRTYGMEWQEFGIQIGFDRATLKKNKRDETVLLDGAVSLQQASHKHVLGLV